MAHNDADSDEARTLGPLQAAAYAYRLPLALAPARKLLTLQGAMLREAGFIQRLCADIQGLHHSPNERVQCNAAGQVVLKLKTAWRDGTAHLVMSPLALAKYAETQIGAEARREAVIL